jgi:hypothetical protein
MKARVSLLYEESAVKLVKRKHARKQTGHSKRCTKREKPHTEPQVDPEHDELDADPVENVENLIDGADYCRNIDPLMRQWIETSSCRNHVANAIFDNPVRPESQKRESICICLQCC